MSGHYGNITVLTLPCRLVWTPSIRLGNSWVRPIILRLVRNCSEKCGLITLWTTHIEGGVHFAIKNSSVDVDVRSQIYWKGKNTRDRSVRLLIREETISSMNACPFIYLAGAIFIPKDVMLCNKTCKCYFRKFRRMWNESYHYMISAAEMEFTLWRHSLVSTMTLGMYSNFVLRLRPIVGRNDKWS